MTDFFECDAAGLSAVERRVSNPTKAAVQIAIHHRRLMDAMTQQGPSEIAAAMDNMEMAIKKARDDLGLGC